jgi:hypothetical protein
MKKILLDYIESYHKGYGAGEGTTEYYEYKCPYGKGVIIEEHDNIPGFREHDVFINCSYCSKLFSVNILNSVRDWKLDGFFVKGLTNSKIRLDEGLKNFDVGISLINFFEFLSWAFSIREKFNIKKADNEYFFALKDVFNLLKHDYDLIKLNFILTNKEEKDLPNSTEKNTIVFGDVSSIDNISSDRLTRYNSYLLNRSVTKITQEIFEDTFIIYNKQL